MLKPLTIAIAVAAALALPAIAQEKDQAKTIQKEAATPGKAQPMTEQQKQVIEATTTESRPGAVTKAKKKTPEQKAAEKAKKEQVRKDAQQGTPPKYQSGGS